MSRNRNRTDRPANQTEPAPELPSVIAEAARDVPQDKLEAGVKPDELVALNETTGQYERLPLANATAEPAPDQPAAQQPTPIAPFSVHVPKFSPRSPANARRLDAAHKHLERMFAEAEAEQIDERKFWGFIGLTITFQEGEAQDVRADKHATDRCSGGRAA